MVRHAMIEVNGPRLSEGGRGPAALAQTFEAPGVHASLARPRPRDACDPWTTFDTDPDHETDCLFVHHTALA